MKRTISFLLLLFSVPLLLAAAEESLFEKGEELFVQNKPAEAVIVLEESLSRSPDQARAYLYLGIAYEQLEQYENAVSAYQRGLPRAPSMQGRFYFNMANNYWRLGMTQEAEDAYGKSIALDRSLTDAYLNRANLQAGEGKYSQAVSDYRRYLSLRPDDPQKEEIEKMIALLSGEVQRAEQARLEEERKQKEEERRQQELLNQVLGSLENAGSETTNLSAGTEETEDYDESFDIID